MSTDPAERDVATAVSLVVGLTDNMQITFQTGFGTDETDAAVNARLDRLVAVADRQRAIAQVPVIEAQLVKEQADLSQFQEDLGRIEIDHVARKASLQRQLDDKLAGRDKARKKHAAEIDVMILEMQDVRQATWNNGAEQARAHGRLGAYEPRGVDKSNLEKIDKQIALAKEGREKELDLWDARFDSEVESLRADIERADAERDQHIGQINVSIRRYTDAVVATTERLDKARAAAGG